MIGYVIIYGAIALVGLFVAAVIYAGVAYIMDGRKLEAAWKEYDALVLEHGSNAREFCPHRVVEFGQTGVPGVVTMTTKWCKTCKKHLGSAKLVESIFGNSWE